MAKYVIQADQPLSKIHAEVYGNFSEHLGRCIYEGLYVGEDSPIPNVNGMRVDVVEALKRIHLPVLRWPGGCFADEYHWKDGIGEKALRKKRVNTHWGGVVEDNSFGTHEFMELCRQIGCKPYINGNVGSGTVAEMQEWVEYMTFDGVSPMSALRERNGHKEPWQVPFFGVGNENWGCGGNMRPEYYADLYRRYQTYVRNFGDNHIYTIACGPGTSKKEPNYDWTDTVMKIAHRHMDGLSLHYYTTASDEWAHKGSATDFDQETYYRTLDNALFIRTLIENHGKIMDRYDPDKRIGMIVDEWGTWFDVEPGTNPGFLYQQNTMRDAMVAALSLNIFNRHSDRVAMANIAQLCNVLQAVVLTEGDKMVLTPTYHVFDLYKDHQDATLLGAFVEEGQAGEGENTIPMLSVSASEDKDGVVHVTAANLSATQSCPVELDLLGGQMGTVTGKILTGSMDAYNDFDTPNTVSIQSMEGITVENGQARFTLPACSVVEITLA